MAENYMKLLNSEENATPPNAVSNGSSDTPHSKAGCKILPNKKKIKISERKTFVSSSSGDFQVSVCEPNLLPPTETSAYQEEEKHDRSTRE